MIDKGYASLKAKEHDKAIQIGRDLIDHNHSSGFEILALAFAGLNRKDKAIAVLEKGVATVPSVWLLWELLGNYYSDTRRYTDAQRCYGKALSCPKADTSIIHYNAGLAFFREGRHAEALSALEKVVSGDPLERVTALRGKIRKAQERSALPDVWFFLVEVRALAGGDMYVEGSTVFLQCCVPATRLEDSLTALDAFLSSERYERLDIMTAKRYTPNDPEFVPPDTAAEAMLEAARTNQSVIALYICSDDSSRSLNPQTSEPSPRRHWWWPFRH